MSADESTAVEVVAASQQAEVHYDVGYWEAEWVATELSTRGDAVKMKSVEKKLSSKEQEKLLFGVSQ